MDICLLCLENITADEGIQVQSTEWQKENITKIIENHFWSMAMKSMSNTALLCMTCWKTIADFHKFYKRIVNAHAYFDSILKTKNQDNAIEGIYQDNEPIDATITTNAALYELKIEVVDADLLIEKVPQKEEENQLVDNQIIELEKVPFKEKEKQLSINEESEIEDQINEFKIEKITRRKSLRSKKPLKNTAQTNKFQKLTNNKILESSNDANPIQNHLIENQAKDITSVDELYEGNEINTDSDSKSNLDYEERSILNADSQQKTDNEPINEFVANNFKLNCGICQSRHSTFNELCNHSIREHKHSGFVSCCNKKFYARSVLVQHIRWHLDPEYFKCKDCGKVLASNRCLQVHSETHKKKERTHICDECEKAFVTTVALKRHKLSHLPDEQKKYSCVQCGKNFGDNILLSNHKRAVHLLKYILVCDICGHHMRSKEVFERHMLKHKGLPIPTVSCDVCGLKLTDPRFLKRHKERQHPKGGRPEFKCDICSKISTTLRAHKHHVQYKHNKGQDFKCTVCQKGFKRAISLTEHMATHTGTVLYTCPYCPKTFKSNANLHKHRKKGHPKEWIEAYRAKHSGKSPPKFKNC